MPTPNLMLSAPAEAHIADTLDLLGTDFGTAPGWVYIGNGSDLRAMYITQWTFYQSEPANFPFGFEFPVGGLFWVKAYLLGGPAGAITGSVYVRRQSDGVFSNAQPFTLLT